MVGVARYEIIDINDTIYASYYNRQYGRNDLLKIIDSNIKKEFKKLNIKSKEKNTNDKRI